MDERSPCAAETDAQIVRRVRAGETAAYGGLVARYERAVLASVLAVVHDAHTAQDVAQDTFVQCYLKLGGLRQGGRFGAWLLKVAHRQAVRAAMRQEREQKIVLAAASTGAAESSLFDDEKQRLLICVGKLPRHERLTVSLRYLEGWSIGEIAQMTGRPVGTVTKQLSRAVQRLRGLLQRSESHAG